jgi:hypothetical protein
MLGIGHKTSLAQHCGWLLLIALAAHAEAGEMKPLPALHIEQTGTLPPGTSAADGIVLANEPEGGKAGMLLDFDLADVPYTATPLARLQLADLGKLKVKRPGRSPSTARGALHVFVRSADQAAELAGSIAVKPAGLPFSYPIDVTGAINTALAGRSGPRKLRLEVRMEGKPGYYEVYGLPTSAGKTPPSLEIVSPEGWSDDWQARLAPITRGEIVYREPCLPLTNNRDAELVLPLLYPAKSIVEVIHNGTREKLQEGRDWVLRDGKLVLPPGSHAPIQLASEFFMPLREGKDGVPRPAPTRVRLEEGTWYHQRQMEVSYEPAAQDWTFPAPRFSLDSLPRLKRLLTTKAPVRIVLFGDSISYGGNASKVQGCWPWQPCFGELVARKLQQHYGSKVTFMNHSRGGATSSYAVGQAESQVGWFRPDLAIVAYGMNDRGESRHGAYRENLEKIIAIIRESSPDTEIVLVTSMLNNPQQPSGLEPVLFLRDEAFRIAHPGLAVVDVATAHQQMLRRKNYLDLSGNGANHPNDFLHRIYAQCLLELLAPEKQP